MCIITTCNHKVESMGDCVDACVKEHNRECQRVLSFGAYCKKCYKEMVNEGFVLLTENDKINWLNGTSDYYEQD